jgi:PAS domain S-box-containing protein
MSIPRIIKTRPLGYQYLNLQPLTLAFKDKTREASFLEYFTRINIKHGRYCHLLAIVFFAGFGFFDPLLYPETKHINWTIRYAVVCPVFIAGLLFSFTDSYRKVWQFIFSGYFLLTGCCYLTMMVFAEPPRSYGLYVGIAYCMIFGYTFIRLRFIWASLCGSLLLLGYIGVAMWKFHFPEIVLLNDLPYLVGINLLGMFVSYAIELSFRQNYFLITGLEQAQDGLQKARDELDEKVKNRTRKLQKLNVELSESEKKYRKLFDLVSDSIFLIDKNSGQILEVNAFACGMYGYLRDEFLAMTYNDLFSGAENVSMTSLGGKQTTATHKHIRKNQTVFTVEISSNFFMWQDHQVYLAVVRDITARLQAEWERTELSERLRQSQKMEAIGTLAGGIAHDFNNILSSIIGYTELSLDDAKKGTLLHQNLKEVLVAGQRAGALVRQILAFSRQSEQEFGPIQMDIILKEVSNLLRPSLPTTIQINLDISADETTIMGDATQVHQIIMNLCTNAAHAMAENGGELHLILENVQFDDKMQFPGGTELSSGNYVKLTVKDTGIGMPEHVKERIFEPFYTTKEKHKGTGMGLAVVHGIINSHQGYIMVKSKPGHGTVFDVYLPVAERSIASSAPSSDETILGGAETILLVDDEVPIVHLVKLELERLGYTIVSRDSSLEALKAFQANPSKFKALITDMTMPNLTGDKLAQKIKAIQPGLPVILCTGYNERIKEKGANRLGVDRVLMKPVGKMDLAKALRQVLDLAAGKTSENSPPFIS